jgi:uridylate kinase
MSHLHVISLGGSLIAPDGIDQKFLQSFYELVHQWLQQDQKRKLILVVGGGAPARQYQNACRALRPDVDHDALDWVGIAATKLNAQLVKTIFADYVCEPVAENPETAPFASGRVLVASGWKPGFSSDYDAVVLAHRFGGKQVINLSNIDHVYTADPKKDPEAKAIKNMSWQDLQTMVGTQWIPGANLPFDPIASQLCAQHGLSVIIAKGTDLPNLSDILHGVSYRGTTIC